MRKKNRDFNIGIIAFAVTVMFLDSCAHADVPASALYFECQNNYPSCLEYLLGSYEQMLMIQSLMPHPLICPVGEVNGLQLQLVFMNYAASMPQLLGMSRPTIVFGSLIRAFHCQ